MKKQTRLWCILVATFLILAVAVALFCVFRKEKQQPQLNDLQKYYNNKCQSYTVQNANLAKGQIVFIGDSITDLYILDDHYADLPVAAYNRGIGGDTTEGVLKRLQVSIFDLQPSVVVLMIGTNDVNCGISNEIILQRYAEIMDSIFQALPDVTLYCMSIIPQNSQLETYSSVKIDQTTQAILALNPKIEALAQEKGAVYLDLFSLLADENHHLIEAYSDDGLHLNVQGLSVWTGMLKPHLLDLLAKEPS